MVDLPSSLSPPSHRTEVLWLHWSPTGFPIAGRVGVWACGRVDAFVVSCLDMCVVSRLRAFVESRLGSFVDYLLEGLLLADAELPVVLNDDALCLQLDVHVGTYEVES